MLGKHILMLSMIGMLAIVTTTATLTIQPVNAQDDNPTPGSEAITQGVIERESDDNPNNDNAAEQLREVIDEQYERSCPSGPDGDPCADYEGPQNEGEGVGPGYGTDNNDNTDNGRGND